jgi:GTP-binding protein LepA
VQLDKIRNFSIVAHIDHGKSTLADRFLLATRAISAREFRDQMLDDMDLERERGITIKASAVRIRYNDYVLNLIDTPGHVDFAYEVLKSLRAVEGVLLLVDAAQGVEAQTVSHLLLAQERKLVIIPVMTKIDLANAEPEKVEREISKILKIEERSILRCSAKTGQGVDTVMNAVVEKIPPPRGSAEAPLTALIFDSKFDVYKGAIIYIRVFDGCVRPGDQVRLMQAGNIHEVEEIGVFTPRAAKSDSLSPGEVGFL